MRTSKIRKISVGVAGASGRMGQEISKILSSSKTHTPFLGWDISGVASGFLHSVKELNSPEIKQVQVWVDFSSPEASLQLLSVVAKNKTPVVCGTTGFSETQFRRLKQASQKIPVLWASNMSLGVAVLNRALRAMSHLEGFDFQIEEIHHNKKKDRPSGTALTLQKTLEDVCQRELPQPLSIRGGGVFGVHKVYAMAEEEFLVFEHTALNRAVFARGAVRAATWLVGKAPGLYSIADTLELED